MKILVINSGSSSIKFKLYVENTPIASGLISKIGEHKGLIELKNLRTKKSERRDEPVPNHQRGVNIINEFLAKSRLIGSLTELDGCGHRVVHGGKKLTKHCIVDSKVMKEIRRVGVMAPLHNPAHLIGIKAMLEIAPKVPNVVVFDTAYHATLPDYAYMYALPYEYYRKEGIRKYGFHGTSHAYVSRKASQILGLSYAKFNAISMHLGNGASVCAIEGGKSIDTSMGLTPLEGLMMGTRCGSIDPAVIPHLARIAGLTTEELDIIMNKKSGFLGICGHNDLREVEEHIKKGDKRAALALNMFIYRLVKHIGAYFTILPRTDALIFTAGIGENSRTVRRLACEKLTHLGFELDLAANENANDEDMIISTPRSKVKILVIHTDEELEIARITEGLVFDKA